mmetsp:Transcript_3309/g.13632  ORF Transcript_3309/g.13632 Transcript_3309/m.13632 type:complete len:245 (+) Transcript_3309:267-1001(+)
MPRCPSPTARPRPRRGCRPLGSRSGLWPSPAWTRSRRTTATGRRTRTGFLHLALRGHRHSPATEAGLCRRRPPRTATICSRKSPSIPHPAAVGWPLEPSQAPGQEARPRWCPPPLSTRCKPDMPVTGHSALATPTHPSAPGRARRQAALSGLRVTLTMVGASGAAACRLASPGRVWRPCRCSPTAPPCPASTPSECARCPRMVPRSWAGLPSPPRATRSKATLPFPARSAPAATQACTPHRPAA